MDRFLCKHEWIDGYSTAKIVLPYGLASNITCALMLDWFSMILSVRSIDYVLYSYGILLLQLSILVSVGDLIYKMTLVSLQYLTKDFLLVRHGILVEK